MMRAIVIVIAVGLASSVVAPSLARAQAHVTVKGWTADGAAVVEIADPLQLYRAQDWAKAAPRRFTAVCRASAADAASDSCTACNAPGTCDVVAQAAPRRPPAVKDKRTCDGPRRTPTACKLAIAIGNRATLVYEQWGPKFRSTIKPQWRGDGNAVVLVIQNETELGDRFDTFAVVELPPAGAK